MASKTGTTRYTLRATGNASAYAAAAVVAGKTTWRGVFRTYAAAFNAVWRRFERTGGRIYVRRPNGERVLVGYMPTA